jgi:arabinogalactan oligomer/maltooligosaccharide transport system substrate-binding protein
MTVSMVACGTSDSTDSTSGTTDDSSTSTDGGASTSDTGSTSDTTGTTEAGSDTSSDSSDAVANLIAATDGTVTLTVWCSELEAYQTVMATLVDQFKAAYPDVTFDITIGAESEANCKDDLLNDVEAGADVFVFADDQINELVTAGALNPVDTAYTYNLSDAYGEGTLAAASVNGQLYAYPLSASNGYFLYYNTNYISDADAASWEGLVAARSSRQEGRL